MLRTCGPRSSRVPSGREARRRPESRPRFATLASASVHRDPPSYRLPPRLAFARPHPAVDIAEFQLHCGRRRRDHSVSIVGREDDRDRGNAGRPAGPRVCQLTPRDAKRARRHATGRRGRCRGRPPTGQWPCGIPQCRPSQLPARCTTRTRELQLSSLHSSRVQPPAVARSRRARACTAWKLRPAAAATNRKRPSCQRVACATTSDPPSRCLNTHPYSEDVHARPIQTINY